MLSLVFLKPLVFDFFLAQGRRDSEESNSSLYFQE